MSTTHLPQSLDELDPNQWESFEPYFAELQTRPLSAENVRDWLADWSHLHKLLREHMAWTSIQRTLDTADPEREAAYLHLIRNVAPPLQRANQKLNDRFLALNLPDDDLRLMVRDLKSANALFRDANVTLEAEMRTTANQYDKITGGLKTMWQGQEKNLSGLEQFLTSADRDLREQAWQAIMTLWLNEREPLNQLFVQLLAQRDQLARNADLPDYRAYMFQEKRRFDYTPDDCLVFHAAIEEAVVPLAERILDRKKRELGLYTLRPWDVTADTSDRTPLRPYRTEEELIQKGLNVFSHVDSRFGRYFSTMAEESLLDLETRPGKSLGAYCSSLPLRRRPFIFMNGSGIHRNVQTLFHEAGHAFHAFETMAHQSLVWHQRPPMEFNEVASMALELLTAPYLTHEHDGFYTPSEAARARIEHLEKIVLFLPYMAVVDLFQHWVYTHADKASDPARLDAKWDELWQRFMRGQDWNGLEVARKTGWHRKQHIFRVPFYYIEYGMAQVGALQIWRNSLTDHAQAVDDYRNALTLGSTVSLPALYEAAGAEFRFDVPMLTELMALVEAQLDELALQVEA
jgi:oligoendopeptidase F